MQPDWRHRAIIEAEDPPPLAAPTDRASDLESDFS
jgi:hypothetical protein